MATQFIQRVADFFVFAVTTQIDVENVLPVLLLRGTRLDLRHVDLELIKRLQGTHQSPRFVLNGE